MEERIKDLLDIIEKLESRINTYWNFYTLVVIAAVGWLMSSKTPFTIEQSIALTIALSLFFLANFSVMRAATIRVVAFERELNKITQSTEFLTSELMIELGRETMPFRVLASYLLHVIVDIAVIFVIWSKVA